MNQANSAAMGERLQRGEIVRNRTVAELGAWWRPVSMILDPDQEDRFEEPKIVLEFIDEVEPEASPPPPGQASAAASASGRWKEERPAEPPAAAAAAPPPPVARAKERAWPLQPKVSGAARPTSPVRPPAKRQQPTTTSKWRGPQQPAAKPKPPPPPPEASPPWAVVHLVALGAKNFVREHKSLAAPRTKCGKAWGRGLAFSC